MPDRKSSSTTPPSGPRGHLPLLLGVELVRADVATGMLGLQLGDAPCGGPVTWALFVDAVLVGRTDEAMTDDAAQCWARRIVGDTVGFQLAHPAGGYWLADSTEVARRPSGLGGWSQ